MKRATRSSDVEPPGTRLIAILDPIVGPALAQFGSLLFGEELKWKVSGIWANEIAPRSSQKFHNHANSMASGIIYAEGDFSRSKTKFLRGTQTVSFIFSNLHESAHVTEFSRDSWEPETLSAGDMIIFPSFLMHGVSNQAKEIRTTIAFNALPERLKYREYEIGFF